jgi:NAD(P)-dependent dehydrogenase (short-subunit alcohol dehydrogenase family)
VLDLDGTAAKQAAEELQSGGASAIGVEVDVSDRAAVDDAMRQVRSELGPIEIIVTSAGFDRFEKFTDITLESWDRMLAVNLTGTFHCVQAAVPDMIDGGWGRIVTISSSSAQSGSRRMAHYVASKGGVIALTKALGLELAPHGITVNTIPPGFIDTPMARRAEARGDLPSIDAVAAQTPVRRAGTPDDIAAACVFLCSEDAGYITGQQINVNGGWYL